MKVKEIEVFPDGRMDVDNAALYLGKATKTLAMMRSQGRGPRFIKRGKIYYRKDDLDEWISEGAGMQSTAQARLSKA